MRSPPRQLRILLVDDSEDDTLMVRTVFSRLGLPHCLETFTDARAALDYLHCRGKHSNRTMLLPDLLLLDINMPGMDGFAMLRELKSDQKLKRVPVIMLTTSGGVTDIRRSYEGGAASFLTKPSDLDGFIGMMRGLANYWTEVSMLPQ